MAYFGPFCIYFIIFLTLHLFQKYYFLFFVPLHSKIITHLVFLNRFSSLFWSCYSKVFIPDRANVIVPQHLTQNIQNLSSPLVKRHPLMHKTRQSIYTSLHIKDDPPHTAVMFLYFWVLKSHPASQRHQLRFFSHHKVKLRRKMWPGIGEKC